MIEEKQQSEEPKKGNFMLIAIIFFLAFIILLALYFQSNSNSFDPGISRVKCLSEKSFLFYSKSCPHCITQQKYIGKYLGMINMTDCLENVQFCIYYNVTQTPTWIINNKYYLGSKKLSELMDISGC